MAVSAEVIVVGRAAAAWGLLLMAGDIEIRQRIAILRSGFG
jgi:hypothetical protein